MGNICKLHTLDPVYTVCNEEAYRKLRKLLSYEYTVWNPGKFSRQKKIYEKCVIVRAERVFYFLSGFVPKCIAFLERNNIEYDFQSDIVEMEYSYPKLSGITFRPYQEELISKGLLYGFGIIKSPTGSGKSIIEFGIISCFPNDNVLLLVHTLDLVQQLYEGLVKYGIEGAGIYTSKEKKMYRVTVCTIQTYSKIAKDWKNHWKTVIIDEGHHIGSFQGMYFNTLICTLAPWRFAFTATLADQTEARFALEGLVGPVIGEISVEEGYRMGFLSDPKIIFRMVPLPIQVMELKKTESWKHVYIEGVVRNWTRNAKAAFEAEREVKNGGSVLILVKYIAHIEELLSFLNIPVEVVKGDVSKKIRKNIRDGMNSGEIKCTIATATWVEGIDIPDLTMIINAAGGKSERETLQKIGRGLRKTDGKNSVRIIEFLDFSGSIKNLLKRNGNHHALHKQSVSRWETYVEQGWKPKISEEDSHYMK